MAQVTSPVILDSTGQQIVQALNNLNNNVKPTAAQIPMSGSDSTSVKSAIDSLNSQLEDKIPTPLRLDRKAENTNSWTFHVPRYSRNSYSYFLLVGGTSISQGFLYHGFVHVGGNDAVGLTLIGGTAVAGITGAYNESNETLTITTTSTNYGGMRLIWLS